MTLSTPTAPDAQRTFTLSDFDFELPPELIAQHPAPERSGSRLLDGSTATPVDRIFRDLPALLQPGDLLVFNDTKVMNARLFGEKPTGGKVELLIERVLGGNQVAAHMRVSKKPEVGTTLALTSAPGHPDHLSATLLGRWPDEQGALFRFVLSNDAGDDPYTLMARHGHVPLPPYITHTDSAEDAQRYQTVFAKNLGAVAAPTAALHFDEPLLAAIDAMGVARAHVTLHVGAGTFQPVKTENLAEHQMHSEWYEVPAATQQAIADCRARGGRVVAVGTTTVRTLESWALTMSTHRHGELPVSTSKPPTDLEPKCPSLRGSPATRQSMNSRTSGALDCRATHAATDGLPATSPVSGDTCIFITPGFEFQVIDALITNFHLPKSSLMMLVSALAGFDHIKALYQHAIEQRYRFFSYGDAMLLVRTVYTRD